MITIAGFPILLNEIMTRGPVMCDLEGLSLSSAEKDLLLHPMVGGIIIFARNYASPQQVSELTQAMRAIRSDLLIAVDQEGGRVQRLREGFTRLPPMQILGNHYRKQGRAGLQLAEYCGWVMASEVRACGIDLSFAPVLDVDSDYSSIIGNRAFSDRADEVIAIASAFIDGMHAAGMGAVGKHFPGHGAVVADSHLETPFDHRSYAEIESRDLLPFTKLSQNLDGIMPAHLVYTAVCDKPAVFSEFWLKDILRQKLGFKGLIFSDDLCMEGAAMMGDYPQRARTALQAGCDMVLVCNNRAASLEITDALERENFPIGNPVLNECFNVCATVTGFESIRKDPRYLECKKAELFLV
jgi:beta-N-acetylhexosaminidase